MFRSERSAGSRGSRGSRGSNEDGRRGRRQGRPNEEDTEGVEQQEGRRHRRRQNQRSNQEQGPTAPSPPPPPSHSQTSIARTRQGAAPPPLCTLIIHGLEHSPLLITKLPLVRRLALIETLTYCKEEKEDDVVAVVAVAAAGGMASNGNQNQANAQHSSTTPTNHQIDRKALEIALSNVQTSPYLSEEDFQSAVLEVLDFASSSGFLTSEGSNSMAEAMLNRNWAGFLSVASTVTPAATSDGSNIRDLFDPSDINEEVRLRKFRDMVNQILLTSRKIGGMRLSLRRKYGNKIHSACTVSKIKDIVTAIFNKSGFLRRMTLVEHESVKNHISNGRFDLLLLPESFDCDEKPRKAARSGMTLHNDEEQGLLDGDDSRSDEEVEECVICFSIIEEDGQMLMLECNHWYCRDCIYSWAETNPTCPSCRAPISANHLSSMRRTNYDSSSGGPIILNIASVPETYQTSQAPQGQSRQNRDSSIFGDFESGAPRPMSIILFGIFEVSTNLYIMSAFGVAGIIFPIVIIFGVLNHWCLQRGLNFVCPMDQSVYGISLIFALYSSILYYPSCFNGNQDHCLDLASGVQNRIDAFLLFTVVTIIMMMCRDLTQGRPPTTLLGESGLLHTTYISTIIYFLKGPWKISIVLALVFSLQYYPVKIFFGGIFAILFSIFGFVVGFLCFIEIIRINGGRGR